MTQHVRHKRHPAVRAHHIGRGLVAATHVLAGSSRATPSMFSGDAELSMAPRRVRSPGTGAAARAGELHIR